MKKGRKKLTKNPGLSKAVPRTNRKRVNGAAVCIEDRAVGKKQ